MPYLISKIEPLIDVQDPGTLLPQLTGLWKDKDNLTTKYYSLSQLKLQQELTIDKHVSPIASLQNEANGLKTNVSTLKSDIAFLKSCNDKLSEDVFSKASELKDTIERASHVVVEKASLEEKLK